MSDQYPIGPTQKTPLERFIGGSPLGVAVRLALLSLLVGFVMTMFGFSPADVVHGAIEMVRNAMRNGFGVFQDIGMYILTGAVLVVPIWLIIRLTRSRG